jgi:outer membrane beta-barrel protein
MECESAKSRGESRRTLPSPGECRRSLIPKPPRRSALFFAGALWLALAPHARGIESALQPGSGAPLEDPNVAVHTVEAKEYPDRGRLEVVLFPAVVQLNGRFTQHFGTMGALVWHLHERFALQLTGGGNWYSEESAFNRQLADRARVQVQQASSLLWTWGVMAGVEVSPAYGKFSFLEDALVQFDFVVSGAAGLGGTRHLLTPAGENGPASFADTGLKFLGTLGAGFRVRLYRRVALRVEIRDVVYTARVASVNGCSQADLERGLACGLRSSTDVDLARSLIAGSGSDGASSDVLNNVGLYLGASLAF